MKCSVCGGTGQINPPHVPANRGGWMDEIYTFGTVCGACNGSGYLPDDDDILDEDILTEDDAFEPRSQTLEERMIELYMDILYEDISDDLPPQLRERWYRMLDGVSLFEAGADATLRRLEQEVKEAKSNIFRYLSVWDFDQMGLLDTSLEIIASRLSRLREMVSEYQGKFSF